MKEKNLKTQGLEDFLKSDFLDSINKRDLEGYELVNKYPLNPPFSYANILYEKKTSGYLYKVDEIKLNYEEEGLRKRLYNLIELNLDSPQESKTAEFEACLNEVIKKNQKELQEIPVSSMEKAKYYLQRDITGFGKIDSLMYDPNIEDISCSGIDKPIYIWHREYDSLPTNIHFKREDLNSFVSRIVFRAGKHISAAFQL